ncbi:hypothetical protein PMZ80_003207 [Knufia obscura]|uniref:Uncharacterized protein n=1 Tax=Knufia obscura TaxID=1635080 RepID=A0ABR0RTK5_9EURO|nr:hypothetical protein PMZ80_003207 [Knufia obscura]
MRVLSYEYLITALCFSALPSGAFAGAILHGIIAPIAAMIGEGSVLFTGITNGVGLIGSDTVAGAVAGSLVRRARSKDWAKEEYSSSLSSASVSSASVASWSSIISVSEASVVSASSELAGLESAARASIASLTQAQAPPLTNDPALDVFTFGDTATKSAQPTKRGDPTARSVQPTTTSTTATDSTLLTRRMDLTRRTFSTNATGWPIAPAGVAQYYLDDCVLDLEAHFTTGGSFTVYQPDGEPETLQVDDVPQRCMVLANVMLPLADKAYPIAFGTASLKWLHVEEQEINGLKTFFNSNGTTPLPGA